MASCCLGSTAYTINGTTESGEVRHRPWGQNRSVSGSTPTTYRYTGQREEASLGLYYYGARWYDPALGRFIRVPLGRGYDRAESVGCANIR